MKRTDLYPRVYEALARGFHLIVSHIDAVQAEEKYTDIEKTFSRYFVSALEDAHTECRGSDLGVGAAYKGRQSSRFDIALGKSRRGPFHTAFELKAVRMPRRNEKGLLFDIGQIDVDFRKLQGAEISSGWIVAFVYGPLVDDCRTDGELLRLFHRQMFVDVSLCSQKQRNHRIECFESLGWTGPQSRPNKHRFAALYRPSGSTKALGAVCYRTT